MAVQRRWAIGIAAGTGFLGLTVTSGLAVLAHYFLEEFSRPHVLYDLSAVAEFGWEHLPASVEPPRSLQRSLVFKTTDGTLLRGDFWAQPQPAPTIVLCHGYRASRSYMRSAASIEYSLGYNVFTFDFRGHGDSDSVITSGGNAEVRDLEAAIIVAGRQPETLPNKIILHSFSMGAAVALLTPPRPDVAGIVADSPFARSDDIVRRLVHYEMARLCATKAPFLRHLTFLFPLLAWLLLFLSEIIFCLRYGFNFVARPESSFKRWKGLAKKMLRQHSIPILLIHCHGDELIPIKHAYQIAAEAKAHDVPLETYFVEGGAHCGAYAVNPEEYLRRTQLFARRCLGDDFPENHRNVLSS